MSDTPTDPREEVKVTWINCPVCDCPDVRRTESKDGDALIFCTNHACRSNGGKSDATNSKLAAEVERQNVILLSHSKAVGEFACGAPSVPDALRKLAADLKNALDGQEYYKNEADVAAERLAKLAAEVERLKTACEKEFQSVEQLSGENMKLAAEIAELRVELEARRKVSSEHDASMLELTRQFTDEIAELKDWKESAISVMPPYQEIGEALGLTIGQSVHDKILPGIHTLRAELEKARQALFQTEKRLDDKLRTALAELEALKTQYASDKERGHRYRDKLMAELDAVRKKLESRNDYIRQLDRVIDDERVADSCINPLEDLQRAIRKLKLDRDTALAAKDAAEKALQRSYDQLKVGRRFLPSHGSFGEDGINQYEGAMHAAKAILDRAALTPAPTQEPPAGGVTISNDSSLPKAGNNAETKEGIVPSPSDGLNAIARQKVLFPRDDREQVGQATPDVRPVPAVTPSNSPADVPSEGWGECPQCKGTHCISIDFGQVGPCPRCAFNLSDALAGKPVVTRDGSWTGVVEPDSDQFEDYPAIARINGGYFYIREDGRLFKHGETDIDLFMLPTEGSGA